MGYPIRGIAKEKSVCRGATLEHDAATIQAFQFAPVAADNRVGHATVSKAVAITAPVARSTDISKVGSNNIAFEYRYKASRGFIRVKYSVV